MKKSLFDLTRKRSGFPYIFVALALLITALAVGPLAPSRAEAKTLVVAVEGDPNRLDPHTHSLWLSYRVVFHLFESFVTQDLTRDDVDRPPVVPALAESWDINDEKTIYTFNLRKGVTFHDGSPWNAEAAQFNFDRLLNREFEHYSELGASINSWWLQDVETTEIVDETTFRVYLKQPNSEFLRRLSQGGYGSAGMISPAAVKKWGNDDVPLHPSGTGPFKFVERTFGEKIVLEKNANYWNADRTPRVDRLIFRPIVDVSARELALLSGEVDIIATPAPDSVEFIESKGFNIVQGKVPTIYNLWLNFREPELQDVRVRRALALAINREELCKDLRREQCFPAYSILPFGGPGYNPDYKPFEYNPEEAKRLLAEAGYPDGFTLRMDWTPGGAGDVNTVQDAEWIQRDWEKIGVKSTIEVFDVGTYFDMMLKGMRQGTHIMSISWGESSFHWLDAVISPNAVSPNGYNSGYYDNPKIGELLSKARAALSEDDQEGYLDEIQRIVNDDMAWIPLHSPLAVYAVASNVTGVVAAPQHWNDMAIVDKAE